MTSQRVSITHVPYDYGAGRRGNGSRFGPMFLHDYGVGASFVNPELWCVNDFHDEIVPLEDRVFGSEIPHAKAITFICSKLQGMIKEQLRRGLRTLVLGGDHSLAMGSIAAAVDFYGEGIGIIHIDAHPDAHTHATSISRHAYGMPFAALLGEVPELLPTRVLSDGQLIQIGADTPQIEVGELELLARHAVQVISMDEIRGRGFTAMITKLDGFIRHFNHLWVSFDLDAIHQDFAPGVALRNKRGFTGPEALRLVQFIGRTGKVVGADIVEMCPYNDCDSITAKHAASIAALLFPTIRD